MIYGAPTADWKGIPYDQVKRRKPDPEGLLLANDGLPVDRRGR
jgi:hypothetical protein